VVLLFANSDISSCFVLLTTKFLASILRACRRSVSRRTDRCGLWRRAASYSARILKIGDRSGWNNNNANNNINNNNNNYNTNNNEYDNDDINKYNRIPMVREDFAYAFVECFVGGGLCLVCASERDTRWGIVEVRPTLDDFPTFEFTRSLCLSLSLCLSVCLCLSLSFYLSFSTIPISLSVILYILYMN